MLSICEAETELAARSATSQSYFCCSKFCSSIKRLCTAGEKSAQQFLNLAFRGLGKRSDSIIALFLDAPQCVGFLWHLNRLTIGKCLQVLHTGTLTAPGYRPVGFIAGKKLGSEPSK